MKRIIGLSLLLVLLSLLQVSVQAQGVKPIPVSISLNPVADTNPVRTQHTFVASVRDANGRGIGGVRVEWILSRSAQSVGDIVEHDDIGATVNQFPFENAPVRKLANNYAVTYTNEEPKVLNMGTSSPADDISLDIGDTWITITSPVEGETHVIAYCPSIEDKNKHKAFAIKYWMDANIQWPENAVNKISTPHKFVFGLRKVTNNAPLIDYKVRWELLDGPEGYLGKEKSRKVENETDENGESSVTLNPAKGETGVNRIKVSFSRPTGEPLASRIVEKRWIAPSLQLVKTGPLEGILGETVVYNIRVSNPGEAAASKVVLRDTLPEGMAYVEASLPPQENSAEGITWSLGELGVNDSRSINVTLRATKVGNCTNAVQVFTDRGEGPISQVVTRVGAPEFYLVKEGPEEVRKGQPATYNIRVENRGSAPARDVLILDELPGEMLYKGVDTAGQSLEWRIPLLEKGASQTFSYTLDTPKTGTYINTARVSVKGKDVYKPVLKTTRVVMENLTIVKTGPLVNFLYKPTLYKIVVGNSGDGDAYDVRVEDILPALMDSTNFKSEPLGTFDPKQKLIRWTLGTLKPNETRTIELTLRPIQQGTTQNEAKAISRDSVVQAFAKTRITGVAAIHISSYDTNDPVEVFGQTSYVIEVRNEGTNACTNLRLVDTLPAEMEFVAAKGPSAFKVEDKRKVVFEAVSVLQPGEVLKYRVTGKAIQKGSAKNHAELQYNEFEQIIIDEEGTTVYE